MEELLCDAAIRGDLELLHKIIAKDNYILDKVLVGCCKGKNPLHVAISIGQAEFVLKLLEIKPKLAEVVDTDLGAALHIASANGDLKIVEALVELSPEMCMARDRDGNNPLHIAAMKGKVDVLKKLVQTFPRVVDTDLGVALHIASANGDLKIVEVLVELSSEMCMARDRDGNNPLHIAAMKGKIDVLKKLVQTCPRAARVILDRGDTIFHLCVNYNQLESLQLLLEMINDPEFVESKDANDNTLLHLAVFGKCFEIVEHVVHSTEIDVNTINGAGWTAMDIHFFIRNPPYGEYGEQVYDPIENSLRATGAKRRSQMAVIIPSPRGKELMQTLMVVSSLFATMAFQVGVNPPGGVWQDDSEGHLAGKSILAYKYPKSYSCFMYFNTVGFLLSSFLILFLLVVYAQLPKRRTGWLLPVISLLTIMITAFAYTYSVIVVSPKHMMAVTITILVSVIVWAFVMILLAVVVVATHERARSKDWDWSRLLPIFAVARHVLRTSQPISSADYENRMSAQLISSPSYESFN